jgi:alpha-D-xyloside xylohydrolase
VLVRDGSVIPHIGLAQSTDRMDWSDIELRVFSANSDNAEGLVCIPGKEELLSISMRKNGGNFRLEDDPLTDNINWNIQIFSK